MARWERRDRHIICAMSDWGSVELEPEVRSWLASLPASDFGHVAFYIDLLAARGVLLSEPHTRQLAGKLRELRFYIGSTRYRISFYVARPRRIILLTVFAKSAKREEGEICRAVAAMNRCVAEGHTAEEE